MLLCFGISPRGVPEPVTQSRAPLPMPVQRFLNMTGRVFPRGEKTQRKENLQMGKEKYTFPSFLGKTEFSQAAMEVRLAVTDTRARAARAPDFPSARQRGQGIQQERGKPCPPLQSALRKEKQDVSAGRRPRAPLQARGAPSMSSKPWSWRSPTASQTSRTNQSGWR